MKVALATPCYGGMIHARTAAAIAASIATLMRRGDACEWLVVEGESLVPRARNMLAHRFLRSGAELLVFVDGDIEFDPAALALLLDSGEDVVGGAYPKKQPGAVELVVERLPGAARRGPLVEVARIGTGFLSISRDALERLCAAHPETAYRDSAGEIVHALFDTAVVGGQYLSEDWLFCDRWRASGGRVWMHDGVRLGHIGSATFRSTTP